MTNDYKDGYKAGYDAACADMLAYVEKLLGKDDKTEAEKAE